ncbi:DNA polymerase III subunit chi [Aquabacterium fontiphilum]|jgi:DNA polymerase-3 subunit chi|uniref:DNA polymerase III subunit chi n=1 Tax=Aquabacterium fontiphilum TaxID=450365 RepID=UPI001377C74F|nr:DNA polymerase III subunit chi [Aquabacterium fontiphilum]NBD21867.1 DNA polymerase III subunit chi [Aquabacterium fontiphilum]
MQPGTVEFHHGMSDKLAYAQRLVRKAYRAGARLVVTGEALTLRTLDQQLWVADEQDFIPHVLDAGNGLPPRLQTTPIWLTTTPDRVPEGHTVLVNLGDAVPDGLAGFHRLFEIVTHDPSDRQLGRQRWKAYQAMGWDVRPHEVTA